MTSEPLGQGVWVLLW